ncbi:MAG: hypothetical protein R3F17_12385 [Planctomycetota bacterium]
MISIPVPQMNCRGCGLAARRMGGQGGAGGGNPGSGDGPGQAAGPGGNGDQPGAHALEVGVEIDELADYLGSED